MQARLTLIACVGLLTMLPCEGSLGQIETPPPLATPAPFDCRIIQGPAAKEFYESNDPINNVVDYTGFGRPSDPETEGMNAALLEKAARALGSYQLSKVWSLLVIRNDRLVFERYFHRASTEKTSNNVHSAAKSILGAAIGRAVNQGIVRLDTKIADLLPQYGGIKNGKTYEEIKDEKKRLITVKHLLTMSSGLQWIEDGTENDIQERPDRVRAILELPFAINPATKLPVEPGTTFRYSTGDSHLLSAVLEEALIKAAKGNKIAKQTVCQYVHENLLAKIGVVAERWGRDPQGYFAGGYNLYLTPRELARFGILYLNGGKGNEHQIVPADWVTDSLTPNPRIPVRANDSLVPDGYGYYFWLGSDFWLGNADRPLPVAMAWGHGGQMVYIIKNLKLVVVITRDTRDLWFNRVFGRSEKSAVKQFESVMKRYVIPAASGVQ